MALHGRFNGVIARSIGDHGKSARLLRCLSVLMLFVGLAACTAPPTKPAASGASPDTTVATTPKRIVVAIAGQPVGVSQAVTRAVLAYSVPGGEFLEALANRGLAVVDPNGLLHPDLAEQVPTLDNGLWVLSPDGTMDTTFTIRAGATWHDGVPFTTDDLAFTARVRTDHAAPALRDRTYDLVSGVEQIDDRTIVVHWSQPYYAADVLFVAGPLPKHILEEPYTNDSANMVSLPYWGAEFVGAGPYRLRDWQQDSSATFDAFDGYPLGRPKIDQVEVRFIPDPSTIIANVLSGTVDLAVGRDVSIDQALRIGQQWSGGRPELAPGGWVVIFPQFIDPTPAVVGDVRFRQALTHALDRTEMAATIQAGQVPVAHQFFGPQDAEYEVAQQAAVRYEYDPRRASQLMADLGYVRDADGGLVDNTRQPLTVPIWSSGGLDMQVKAMLSVADYWKQIGVDAEPTIVPTQRWHDREYVASFPAFRLNQQSIGRNFMMNLLSSAAPTRENQFVGANYSRYRNPDLDALINSFVVTVRPDERSLVVQQIVRLTTEQAVLIGLFDNATPVLVANRIQGVAAGKPGWNVHLWDVS